MEEREISGKLIRKRQILYIIIVLVAGVLGTVAFTNYSKNETQIMGLLLTIEDVVQMLKTSGVSPVENNNAHYFTLGGIKPIGFELSNHEIIFVYVYDSEVVPRKAYRDFDSERAKYDMPIPLIYEVRNVLIFYSHRATMIPEESVARTEFGSKIEQAAELLHGDEVTNVHGKIINKEKFQRFITHVNEKKPDKVRIRSTTIEGDPIFHDVIFDGSRFLYTYDNSYDTFGGNNKGKKTVTCNSINKIKDESYVRYEVKGCSDGDVDTILFAEPLPEEDTSGSPSN